MAFTILTVAMILVISTLLNIRNVSANGNYAIEHVDHTINVMYNAYVLMNDTIRLSGQLPDSFLLGFPYRFGPYVLRVLVSDADNPSNTFPATLNEPLENHSGFYGVNVDFSRGAPQNFTVEILFSNRLIAQDPQNASVYSVAFPAFPSLVKVASSCNSTVVLPKNAQYVTGTVSSLAFAENNLTAFTSNSSALVFSLLDAEMQLFDVNQMDREIRVSEFGDVTGSDSYYITNQAALPMSAVDVVLPAKAFDTSAEDQFGGTMDQPTLTAANTSRYEINLTRLDAAKSSRFTVNYRLPSDVYIKQQAGNGSFALGVTLFRELDYYINETTVTIVLPEGAKLQTFSDTLADGSYGIGKNVFQERVTIDGPGMFSLTGFSIGLVYDYNPLWSAFRPTIWVMFLTVIGVTVVLVLRRPRGPTLVAASMTGLRLRPEYIKSFVEAYEEKMKVTAEIDSLESKAQKGRIQRRRYKVQRKTLETHLDTLSRNLTELKEKMRGAGGHYANLMRTLEVAETEMNEVDANVKSIEARHGRGEISLETYRKLLGDYHRRKDRTETTIDGILLRLREEIR